MGDSAKVFRWRDRQPVVWYRRRPDQSNHWCLYCGAFVGPGSAIESDCEHLIGKNFVPAGTLRGDSFNFLFRACCECNRRKSTAEDHVSSVTLFTGPGHEPAVNDLAQRKAAKSIHPVKRGPNGERVPVQDAYWEQTLHGELMAGVGVTVNLVGPPQLHDPLAHLLARHHVQGPTARQRSLPPLGSADHERVLVAAVGRFRRAVERYTATAVEPAMTGFPRGACGYASKLLARYLEEQGFGPATLMANARRGRRGEQSHAWLEVSGWFIDITADQFPDGSSALVVRPDSAFHRTFRGVSPYPYRDMIWSNDAGERFAQVYAAILRHLEPEHP